MHLAIGQLFSLRRAAAVLLGVVAFALAGQSAQATDITGKWEGKWEECDRCGTACAYVHKMDCNRFRVCFTGTCHHVLPFLHDVKFCAVGQAGDCILLEGTSTLRHISYKGRASCTQFIVDYCCHHTKGRFILTRCNCHHGAPPVAAVSPYNAPPVYRAPPPPVRGF